MPPVPLLAGPIANWQSHCVGLWHLSPDPTAPQLGDPLPPPPESSGEFNSEILTAREIAPQWLRLILTNHEFNFRLWHEEDLARDCQASDATIAAVKRRIDRLNQQRNDALERIDVALAEWLDWLEVRPSDDAALATETPGSAIDRLSILALRIYHYEEQVTQATVATAIPSKLERGLQLARLQRDRLVTAVDALLDDIFAGRCRHDVFRQLKMYNDPELSPTIRRSGDRSLDEHRSK